MNQDNIDYLAELEQPQHMYGSFWNRFWAIFIDLLILGGLTFAFDWYNKTTWKSITVLIILFLIKLCYKPFMEIQWGATIGKKAMRLLVVNKELEKAGLKEIVLRNIFNILSTLFSFVTALALFRMVSFQDVTSLKQYGAFAKSIPAIQQFNYIFFPLIIAEIICLCTDPLKRSLHDRIAQTLVIRLPKE